MVSQWSSQLYEIQPQNLVLREINNFKVINGWQHCSKHILSHQIRSYEWFLKILNCDSWSYIILFYPLPVRWTPSSTIIGSKGSCITSVDKSTDGVIIDKESWEYAYCWVLVLLILTFMSIFSPSVPCEDSRIFSPLLCISHSHQLQTEPHNSRTSGEWLTCQTMPVRKIPTLSMVSLLLKMLAFQDPVEQNLWWIISDGVFC